MSDAKAPEPVEEHPEIRGVVEIANEDPEYPTGKHVWVRHVAKIVGYGRSRSAAIHWFEQHEGEVVTCEFGNDCDALVDSEGPIVEFGDGHRDWFPGQSCSCLERVTDAHENAIAGMTAGDRG